MSDPAIDLLHDAVSRIREEATGAVAGLDDETLTHRLAPGANTIAWLVWHLARVQDDHVAGAAGTEQVWTAQGWVDRFGLPFDPSAIGYGQDADDVGQVRASAQELAGYVEAVCDATQAYVRSLAAEDLSRVVDESWEPPVTLAVRLVSVVSDDLQHAGQAAFIRGILTG